MQVCALYRCTNADAAQHTIAPTMAVAMDVVLRSIMTILRVHIHFYVLFSNGIYLNSMPGSCAVLQVVIGTSLDIATIIGLT